MERGATGKPEEGCIAPDLYIDARPHSLDCHQIRKEMKRSLLCLFLFIGCFVGSCQCSDKPPVPPVEDSRQVEAGSLVADPAV